MDLGVGPWSFGALWGASLGPKRGRVAWLLFGARRQPDRRVGSLAWGGLGRRPLFGDTSAATKAQRGLLHTRLTLGVAGYAMGLGQPLLSPTNGAPSDYPTLMGRTGYAVGFGMVDTASK